MSIATESTTERLISELYTVPGKAEIVGGRIVMMSPTGDMPGSAAFAIVHRSYEYSKEHGGRAYGDNVGFLVNLPDRKSFCPDASYYTGPRAKMKFLPEAPVFAVEVRSEGDYGPNAEQKMANKRSDYFAAGAKVVWDVDLLSDDVVKVYRVGSPGEPTIYGHGEMAEAEPAVPGWKFAVDELFE
jgi:Uma2 family endonuclease